jgi:hypothetical protein
VCKVPAPTITGSRVGGSTPPRGSRPRPHRPTPPSAPRRTAPQRAPRRIPHREGPFRIGKVPNKGEWGWGARSSHRGFRGGGPWQGLSPQGRHHPTISSFNTKTAQSKAAANSPRAVSCPLMAAAGVEVMMGSPSRDAVFATLIVSALVKWLWVPGDVGTWGRGEGGPWCDSSCCGTGTLPLNESERACQW